MTDNTLTVLGVDGIRRSFDEHYDNMSDVREDPYGAWDAIQKLTQKQSETGGTTTGQCRSIDQPPIRAAARMPSANPGTSDAGSLPHRLAALRSPQPMKGLVMEYTPGDLFTSFFLLIPLLLCIMERPLAAALIAFLCLLDGLYSVLTSDGIWWLPTTLALILTTAVKPSTSKEPSHDS